MKRSGQDGILPNKFNVTWIGSEHHSPRPDPLDVTAIVLHHTVFSTLEETTRWFLDPSSLVSAHFTVGRDGSVVQHVSCFRKAWHAGNSCDCNGRMNVNEFSIGIELVNIGDGCQEYPQEQIASLRQLICILKRRFSAIDSITSHARVALPPGRKVDPLGFPWEELSDLGLKLIY